MASNYRIRAILAALPAQAPARHYRLLMALETVTASPEGWREVGMSTLAAYAGLSQPTARLARDELVEAKLIEIEVTRRRGPHARWRWRILVDGCPPMKPRVSLDQGVSNETPGPF